MGGSQSDCNSAKIAARAKTTPPIATATIVEYRCLMCSHPPRDLTIDTCPRSDEIEPFRMYPAETDAMSQKFIFDHVHQSVGTTYEEMIARVVGGEQLRQQGRVQPASFAGPINRWFPQHVMQT